MQRWRRNVWLLAVSIMALVFVLLNTIGLPQSTRAENSGDSKDYEEVFSSALDTNYPDIVYIDWSAPKASNECASAEWFLGAYRTEYGGNAVAGYGSNGVSAFAQKAMADKSESLCIDLERNILTNNLYYALNCSFSKNPALYLNLRDTNGVVLVESGNLLAVTNAIWYADGTNAILLFDVPTAKYPSAAVLQLRHSVPESDFSEKYGSPQVRPPYTNINSNLEGEAKPSRSGSAVIVQESLLFINNGSDLWLSAGQGNVMTNYSDGSLGNFYDWARGNNSGNSTNKPGEGDDDNGGNDDGDDQNGEKGKIIYVDQAIGNDTFTGRAPAISANKKGPKRTVRSGLSIAGTNDTMVIRAGNYRENLDISGKNVKVFIEGKVRL